MQYKTNQLEKTVLFSNENYQHIAQDFWVYKFSIDAKKVGYQYSLIDEIKQQLQGVKSVVYLASKAFYALFEKSKFKNEFELEDQINKLITNSDEVQPSQITNLRDENEIDKRHLAQLLFNSLANTSSKNAKCSNITGGLYWVVKTNGKQGINWQYITLKLELDYHLHLKIEVKTFSNLLMTGKMNFDKRATKLKDLIQYEILPDNIRSMRRLKSSERVIFKSEDEQKKLSEKQKKKEGEKAAQTYIIAQADGKKNTVSFLDFSDWNSFETSKSGVLYLFLKEVQEQLAKYITIKFVELPFSQTKTEFDKELSDSVKAKIKAFYQSKPIVINIADSLKDDQEANKLAQDLQIFLTDHEREYKANNVILGDLSENVLNFRIIRSKENYDEQNDEHCNKYQGGKYKNYLVQHITTDDFEIDIEKKTKKGEKIKTLPEIDKILNEIYIKNDIKQGKITILDWTFGEWLFMGKSKSEDKSESDTYNVLKIDSNGNLFFENSENKWFKTEIYNRYVSIYDDVKFNGRESLNCLLVSNHQDINLIFETPRFTIQEIEKIGETLDLERNDGDKFLDQLKMIKLIKDFCQSTFYKEKDKESIYKLVSLVENYKPNFSKKELIDLFGKEKANLSNKGENHLQGRFCRFYQEQTGDVLKSFFRGKAEKEELLSSRLDIFYQVNENQTEASYFVGEISEGIQSKFQNATNIRKIKAVKNLQGQQSKLVFDQLLQTMAVDFVKQGSLTVLPFPFKYLREIMS
jgi:hypothetical protein